MKATYSKRGTRAFTSKSGRVISNPTRRGRVFNTKRGNKYITTKRVTLDLIN